MAEALVTGGEVCSGKAFDSEARATNSLQGKTCINCLPNEVLVHMFSFLCVKELCVSVAPVCAAWRDLATTPTLWKHLVLNFYWREDTEREKRVVRASPLLLSLEVNYLKKGRSFLFQVAACKMLKKLKVTYCNGLTYRVLKSIQTNCPNMQHLNIEGCSRLTSTSFHLISGFTQLRYLDMSFCSSLSDAGLKSIATHCKHLEYLRVIGNTELHDSSVICLTKELRHCLKELLIDGVNLTDTSYKSLSACMLLEKLTILRSGEMSDDGLSGLYSLKRLTLLKLSDIERVTSAALTALFMTDRLPQLAHLNVDKCVCLDDHVLSALARNCPKLITLYLSSCEEVTDAGVAEVMAGCPLLQELYFDDMPGVTGRALINIPTVLPHLRALHIVVCHNIDETIIQHLKIQMPSLNVSMHLEWSN